MITEVKEIQVEIKDSGYKFNPFTATIRDGEVTEFSFIGTSRPNMEKLKAYIEFCKEVIEAIKQTS